MRQGINFDLDKKKLKRVFRRRRESEMSTNRYNKGGVDFAQLFASSISSHALDNIRLLEIRRCTLDMFKISICQQIFEYARTFYTIFNN